MSETRASPKIFCINLMGDVMFGRLIDQLLPNQVDKPEEARVVATDRQFHSIVLDDCIIVSPWGRTLPFFHSSDLDIVSLKTSATGNFRNWPVIVFNYKKHPANIAYFNKAKLDDYAMLASDYEDLQHYVCPKIAIISTSTYHNNFSAIWQLIVPQEPR